jgi:hypothetical protein
MGDPVLPGNPSEVLLSHFHQTGYVALVIVIAIVTIIITIVLARGSSHFCVVVSISVVIQFSLKPVPLLI